MDWAVRFGKSLAQSGQKKMCIRDRACTAGISAAVWVWVLVAASVMPYPERVVGLEPALTCP